MPCHSTTGKELSLLAAGLWCLFCGTCALNRMPDVAAKTHSAIATTTMTALHSQRLRRVRPGSSLAEASVMVLQHAKCHYVR